MSPNDASVYTETFSTLTWVLLLAGIVLAVLALMGVFIALVHRAGQATAAPALAAAPAQRVAAPASAAPGRRLTPTMSGAAARGA